MSHRTPNKTKSRTLRRIYVKATKGVRVHYKKRKPQKARCAECKAILKGIPRERPYKMRTLPKTKKRPSRPYAGVLCSKCLTKKIKESIRK